MGKATGFLEKTRELPKGKAPEERAKGRRTPICPQRGNALYGMDEGDVGQWADKEFGAIQGR